MTVEILDNPATGESMTILESTVEVFRAQYSLGPRCSIPGAHFHPNKEQKVSVLSGEMHLRINGVNKILRAGETATIPKSAHHFQWNSTDSAVVAIEEIRPAGDMHDFFVVLFGLARDGKTDSKGYPSPLVAAAFMSEFRDSIRPAPLALRALFRALAPVAAALGYRSLIARYRRATS